MPCKGGYRQRLEDSKRRAIEEREAERTDPFRKLWLSLVDRVFNSPNGFDSLSEHEKLYFAVGELEGEVYNGGFDQYFFNSSASHYAYAEAGLVALGAIRTLDLLRQAKEVLFSASAVPTDTRMRRQALRDAEALNSPERQRKLDLLDKDYCNDPDGLTHRTQDFARNHALIPLDIYSKFSNIIESP
jgi:hypothetical protein